MLYAGFGDGGSANDPEGNGQNRTTLLGKILADRPEPGESVPADNPFVGRAAGRPQIWMTGLRNPWRFSFDAETGDLWIGDVGQNRWEEIDWLPKATGLGRGANLGWNLFEGDEKFATPNPAPGAASAGPFIAAGVHLQPRRRAGARSPADTSTGARRSRTSPGPTCSPTTARPGIRALRHRRPDRSAAPHRCPSNGTSAATSAASSSFFEDHDKELYVISLDGTIDKIVPA